MTLLDLYVQAEKAGVVIDDFPLQKISSLSLPIGTIAINIDKIADSCEEKAVLAHELGHIETCSFYNLNSPLDIRKKHENRADKWAIQQLVPKAEFESAIEAGNTEVWQFAELFDVPCEFMAKAISFYQTGNLDD